MFRDEISFQINKTCFAIIAFFQSPKRGKFVISKKTSPKNLAAKRERNQTRTFTQADIQDLVSLAVI